jgi:murein DD-endopeptidase MepM/ murein hydrolase activator NlpD
VISDFGPKSGGMRNDGINISASLGANVAAAENGVVAYAGNELKGLGNLLIIRHDKDYMSVYAHARDLKVKKGDRVSRGQVIAAVGKTGRVSSPQLHFEIRQKTKAIDPASVLERK